MFKVYTNTQSAGVSMIQCQCYVWAKYSNVTGHNTRVRLDSEEVKIAAGHYDQAAKYANMHRNKRSNTNTGPTATSHYLLITTIPSTVTSIRA